MEEKMNFNKVKVTTMVLTGLISLGSISNANAACRFYTAEEVEARKYVIAEETQYRSKTTCSYSGVLTRMVGPNQAMADLSLSYNTDWSGWSSSNNAPACAGQRYATGTGFYESYVDGNTYSITMSGYIPLVDDFSVTDSRRVVTEWGYVYYGCD